MTSTEVYKSKMSKGLRDFFEKYESSMRELIDNLDSDGLLLRNFNEEKVIRLINLAKSCNMSLKLSNDFNSIVDLDEVKRKENLAYLKKAFRTEDEIRIGEHCLSSLVNSYTTILEKLKIYFLFFIDWSKLNKRNKDIYGLGGAIKELLNKYPDNLYLNYFNAGTRNSFTHYTFFFGEKSKIILCSEIFDKNPKEMPLHELMKEIQNLGVLTEGFYLSVKDKLGMPEINLEMLER